MFKLKIIAIFIMIILCVCTFIGCDNNSASKSNNSNSTSETNESSSEQENEEESSGEQSGEEKKQILLKYEEYCQLSPSEKDAYFDTFDPPEAFFEWILDAQATFREEHPDITIETDGTIDLSKLK